MTPDPSLGTPARRWVNVVVPCLDCGATAKLPMTPDDAKRYAYTLLACADDWTLIDSGRMHPAFEFEHARPQG